ncbi:PREDICTED: uncharacterized protein LOC106747496 [Dinoponera quadriceps]|uniref:Uncharacterized protein LOC106747496 n=1 Tax=Dinoponera quadriceps TaxID=609295 RepID=A0A6P3XQP6_DINQU|nr:PREDICTED: uncharacterized protein LOC106747496 [Dinoponera quadriceps]XP_014480550.1 PREDICTED: uncharacterized protein LOC106747496 [Dinoponera quadriceps]XP_014480552.1 PREDICTED: uncharacterized protein LOC106747496 [Dinoponera quadriceps]XP_014480553.1 PREDICTED: uncharacterized protein LOC106747496 [Dinoponera quadriceps]XP_014480554.1 PREDICTED: uncharacterized protein LOC106747496 [Dinoponera quadriceps]
MYRSGLFIWCALLLTAACAMENPGWSLREWKDTAQHDSRVNFVSTLNHDKNAKRSDEISHEYRSDYIKDIQEEGNLNMLAEIRANFMKIDDRDNHIILDGLYPEYYKNFLNKRNNTVNICCSIGYRMTLDYTCVPDNNRDYIFPIVYGTNNTVNELFQLTVWDPCKIFTKNIRLLYDRDIDEYYMYEVLTNGSVLLLYHNILVSPSFYCFTVISKNKYELVVCAFTNYENQIKSSNENTKYNRGILICLTVSLLSLLLTFV